MSVLTELEKLLLTDNIDQETVSKITREPRPPENYSVVDNIYHRLVPGADELLRALEILHHNLLNYNNDSSNPSNSNNANGLHSLPRQLLPLIADYGHNRYFCEEITPIYPRYPTNSRIGKVVKRYVKDVEGNQAGERCLLLHGPQVTTYFEDSVPHVVRRLFIFGKPIIEEDIIVPHEVRKAIDESKEPKLLFVPRVYSVRLLNSENRDRGYIGYGFEYSNTALMRFSGLEKMDKELFPIVPSSPIRLAAPISTFPKCQLIHLDLSPLDPTCQIKKASVQ